MYVNSSLTAQRIHICTGLRFFWIRDKHSPQPLVERKIQSGNLCSAGSFAGFQKMQSGCRSLFELEVFQVRKLELYPGHGTIC